MKLIYVIAQAHTGSTLMDCILGTHPDFVSSGELRYLNWQLYRTQNQMPSVKAQDICTCERNFRDCNYWSKVFRLIKEKSGADIVVEPSSFDTAYFKQFAFQNRGGVVPTFNDKVKAYVFRQWVELGFSYKRLLIVEPKIKKWLDNNWLLYESMAKVANKPIVVDSSKHLLIALLLQQYRPKDVYILFIHRSIEGLVASAKRWSNKKGQKYNINKVLKSKKTYENRVAKYKSNISGLQHMNTNYEDFVSQPASFLHQVVKWVGASKEYSQQANDNFYIDPSLLHLVAGNPMRYKGKQLVKSDTRWKTELTDNEIQVIQNYKLS